MKLLLILTIFLPACGSVFLSAKGDFVYLNGDTAQFPESITSDTGGLGANLTGTIRSDAQGGFIEAERNFTVNVGGADGITIEGPINHSENTRQTGRQINRGIRTVAGKVIGLGIVNGSVNAIETLTE